MAKTFKIGLAGTGDIGRLHAKALRARDDVELCVCRGVKSSGADTFAREFGATVYPSYSALLADPSVAAADICVPNDLHREFVEKAAAAGKHILCEKPIAMSLEDANAMIEAARRAGVLLMIAHPLRFWPEYVKLREVILSGSLGPCRAITMRRLLSLLISVTGERGWRHKPERMGGAILDLQIHDLDFLNWVFGLPEQVYCAAAPSADGGLNHTYATLKFPNGTIGFVESSYLLQGDPMIFTAKAVCERGTLDYNLHLEHFSMHAMAGLKAGATESADPASLVCYRAGEQPQVLVRQEPNILDAVFARELSYFVNCAQGKTSNQLAPVEDAVGALKLALACRESVERGLPVKLHERRDDTLEVAGH
ncbi:MAG: Gfo/Idh/MocA family oxidoreductase [Acidobacteriales bacterium]|nr:Gfo/Idh/MocA family oxidoreductase [Terriglobales bacterium]